MPKEIRRGDALPRINLRIFLFCAAGLCFGVFLCSFLFFGWLRPSDFVFPAVFFLLALLPPAPKRLLALSLCTILCGGLGAGLFFLYAKDYVSGPAEGTYAVEGTVTSVAVHEGYSEITLSRLTIGGAHAEGKMTASISSEEVRPADKLFFTCAVSRVSYPRGKDDVSLFTENIRYRAEVRTWEKTGVSFDPFLRLNAAIYNALTCNMEYENAMVGYALLTGNSDAVDEDILSAVRAGGIAHVFAVSGLHIGIVFGAVLFVCRPMKKYAFLPASVLSLFYCAVCGFSASAVRAAIMCFALGILRAAGRKYDLLSSLSLAASLTLLLAPAQFLAAGFRLSYCAVLALALFSGSFTRFFRRLRLPLRPAQTLAATYSVQFLTFPLLFELYGYVSLWGLLLNPLLVPLLPVLFLTLLICTLLSAIIPPAAAFFCMFPEGLLSLLLLFFAVTDFSAVLTGFSLGLGGTAYFTGAVLLSEKVRFGKAAKCAIASAAAAVCAACILFSNAVFAGCTVEGYGKGDETLALVRTREAAVLVIGGNVSLRTCTRFLARRYGGTLDGVIVLSGSDTSAAPFLGAEKIFLCKETETGLRGIEVVTEKTFSVQGLLFRFEEDGKLTMTAEGSVAEFDFDENGALGADLFLGTECAGLKFFLRRDIIYSI